MSHLGQAQFHGQVVEALVFMLQVWEDFEQQLELIVVAGGTT